MATEVIHSIRASGGDYTSLSAWEAAQQRDLVSADEIAVAECYHDWPGGLDDIVQVAGWTTDATHYVVFRAAAGHETQGTTGSGFYINATTSGAALDVNQFYTRIEHIEAQTKGSYTYGTCIDLEDRCTAIGCLAVINDFNTNGIGFRMQAGAGSNLANAPTAINCVSVGPGQHGYRSNAGGVTQTAVCDNCVSAGATNAFFSANNEMRLRNCVAYDNTTAFSGSFHADSSNNASFDAATNTPPGSNPLLTNVTSSDFVDATNDDFHLAAGSILIGAGTNLYSEFTTDFDGDAWPSTGAWDIGFDYYVSETQASLGSQVYASGAFNPATVKVRSGGAFVMPTLKRYVGGEWV